MLIRFVCWFSRHFWDIHDYPHAWGGSGYPWHFHVYRCWHCGREFSI